MSALDDNEITGSISTTSSISGSISQGNQPSVTRVTVPGPAGPTGASGSSENKIAEAADVDTTSFGLNDGAVLQFRASTQKFVTRTELDTTSGNLVLNGGNF
jgi:hypothetical protein|tara:strand:- start:751 stop:1056 length:306 start_codon:yes stop_codon:yes gene_type:complete